MKKLTHEERVVLAAERARSAEIIRRLRKLVEAGEADIKARAAAGRPYASPPGYTDD